MSMFVHTCNPMDEEAESRRPLVTTSKPIYSPSFWFSEITLIPNPKVDRTWGTISKDISSTLMHYILYIHCAHMCLFMHQNIQRHTKPFPWFDLVTSFCLLHDSCCLLGGIASGWISKSSNWLRSQVLKVKQAFSQGSGLCLETSWREPSPAMRTDSTLNPMVSIKQEELQSHASSLSMRH